MTTTPEAFDVQAHVLDHTGAFYDWFDSVTVNPITGDLWLVASQDAAEYLIGHVNPPDSRLRTFTPDQVWGVIQAEHVEWQHADPANYDARYYADLVGERFDDLDGDMNVVDSLLQRLAFGEIVFG